LEELEDRRLLATFTVTNTGDNNGVNPAPNAGTGTLRQAIVDANAAGGTNQITFSIGGTGVRTVAVLGPLPAVSDAVDLDATTLQGFSGTPLLELNGTNAGSKSSGLVISGNNASVRGLIVNRFGFDGVEIPGNDNLLAGCWIGTDSTGTVAAANGRQGVLITGAGNTVGGTGAHDPDTIAGNTNDGLQIAGTATTGNVVQGNRIGTDPTGKSALGNGRLGILVNFGATGNLIGTNGDGVNDALERNIISGNTSTGVDISDSGTNGNVVAGNFIGTDSSGTIAIGNGGGGLDIVNGAQSNRVGTDGLSADDAGQANVISGNTVSGVAGVYLGDSGTNQNVLAGNLVGTDATGQLALGNGGVGVFVNAGAQNNIIGTNGDGHGDSDEGNTIAANPYQGVAIDGSGTNGNVVAGNRIGTDSTGTKPLGNQNNGIWILQGAQSNRIGVQAGDAGAAAEPNVIAANAFSGIAISDPGTQNNVVAGNDLGTDATGTLNLGNGYDGVSLSNGAQANTVGGATGSLGNVIAFNVQDGIGLVDATTTGNTFRANRIFNSSVLGIDLGQNGVSPNHTDHALGSGPNDLQNKPAITSASPGTTTTIVGTLSSVPAATFTIDFYAAPVPEVSHFGASTIYLGSTQITTDSIGNGTFSASLATTTTAGEWVSATATSASGDTSEFSAAEPLPWNGLAPAYGTWTSIGPGPIGDTPEFSGRIEVAAADPTDPNVMYVGADGGGLWKTSDWMDRSPTWTPLTDFQPSLAVGSLNSAYQALAVAPSDHRVVYAAVGGPGGGILKSTDAGSSWSELANSQFDQDAFGSLVVDPSNDQVVYVTVWYGSPSAGGVYKSTDGGATWNNTTSGVSNGWASDLVLVPGSPEMLYAGLVQGSNSATNGIYQSSDAGGHWTKLAGGLPNGANIGNSIKLAASPADNQTLYATVFDTTSKPTRYVTRNAGSLWTPLASLPKADELRTWHVVLAVDPSHANIVYVNGDHTVYQSTDYGADWTGPLFGDDPVGGSFDDTGAFVLVGDRGVYRWAGGTAPWEYKQGNLATAEFYTLTLDPTNPNVAYGISQDQLAALEYTGSSAWNYLNSGDEVGKILVDPTRPNRLYNFDPNASPPTKFLERSDDGGVTWTSMTSNLNTAIASFNYAYTSQKAFVMDPSNPDRLLLGTNRVFETTDDAADWTDITPNGLSGNQYITALGIAPSQGQTIYAATADGKLFTTTNDGANWSEVDNGLPQDSFDEIGSIQIDPSNPSHVFIATANFANTLFGSSRVWVTTNGGVTWTGINGNLPTEDWTTSLVVDWTPSTPVLYLGTARGVFSSTDQGSTWARFGAGLPNVVVTDLELVPQQHLLGAATYGRGIYEIRTAPVATQLVITAQPPAQLTAGTTFSLTVAAEDSQNHVDTSYHGPITLKLAANPGSDTLGGTVTLNATNGVAAFTNLTLTVAKAGYTIQASTSDGLQSAPSQTITVVPAALKDLLVTSSTSATAGLAQSLTVTAVDAYNNTVPGYTGTVHFTTTDSKAALPADYPFVSSDNSTHTFSITLKTAGTQAVRARDTVHTTYTGVQTGIVVSPAAASTFLVGYPSATTAGVAQTFKVTVQDAFGNTVQGYTGTVHFTSTDPKPTLPADYPFTTGDAGVHTFVATLTTAGTRSITVTDTAQSSVTGTKAGITVSPSSAAVLNVVYPTSVTAGTTLALVVTAVDAYNNTVPTYAGTVHFTSTDPKATLPADYPFVSTDKGTHTFAVALKTAGSQAVRARDTVHTTITGVETGIQVSPAGASTFAVGFPTATVAGVAHSFPVTAYDAYQNVVTGYTGTVHFTSSDSTAVLPADYPFQASDHGTHTFVASLKKAGTWALRATDAAHGSITGLVSSIAVSPAAASTFAVSFPTTTTAGSAQSFVVTAKDPYGNIATGYTGTVHFTSSDSSASLPADYPFVTSDAGTHTFSATFKRAGSQALRATDTAHASITGLQTGITVNSAAAAKVVVSGYPTSTTVGTANNFTVTLYDAFSNVAVGYTGTIQITSDDPQVVIAPVEWTFGASDAGTHQFSATFNTKGTHKLTATDTKTSSLTGSQTGIVVN
jgi:hypothetical protein